jgi:hypothetical protein
MRDKELDQLLAELKDICAREIEILNVVEGVLRRRFFAQVRRQLARRGQRLQGKPPHVAFLNLPTPPRGYQVQVTLLSSQLSKESLKAIVCFSSLESASQGTGRRR